MKSVAFAELKLWHGFFSKLVGAQLQEVQTSEHAIGLGFYHLGQMVWVVFDLHTSSPFVGSFDQWPVGLKKKNTPVLLFARAHVMGRRLNAVHVRSEFGRVLEWDFGSIYIEVRLIPHQVNVLVRTNDKRISWNKVQDLALAKSVVESATRTLEEMNEEWRASFGKDKTKEKSNVRALEKKQKAAKELEATIAEEEWKQWQNMGDWLKQYRSLEVPKSWAVDRMLSVNENMSRAYEKARTLKEKARRTQGRLEALKEEIARLEKNPSQDVPAVPRVKLDSPSLRTRKRQLTDEVVLYVGRSAKDNLALLRKAQAWDIWVHLKDYPGAHGIVYRPRGLALNDTILSKAALFVARESAHKHLRDGDKFECLIVECRFVRPIKGDRIGRVTFQNERVMRLIYKESVDLA